MIKVLNDKGSGRSIPIIECDHCGKQINSFDEGNYAFKFIEKKEIRLGPQNMIFLHKDCSWDWDNKNPGAGIEDLDMLFIYLKNSMRLDEGWVKGKAGSR